MERQPPLKMTPFDRMVTSDFLQTVKSVIPYLPPEFQRMAGIYAKMTEFMNAMFYFQPPYDPGRGGRLRQQELDGGALLTDLKEYLPPQAGEMLEEALQMQSMLELLGGLKGENFMDALHMEDLMGMFQAEPFQTTQTERTDADERMDEPPGDGIDRSGEAGADPDGGEADQREDGEIPRPGAAHPDHWSQ